MNFDHEIAQRTKKITADDGLRNLTQKWTDEAQTLQYSYNFKWLGRPIIQYPQDIVAMQEIIYETKSDLIIETGIAHGGSLICYSSLLQWLDLHYPLDKKRMVLGIDIDIREHNRVEIDKHPARKNIEMFAGSSIEPEMINKVKAFASDYNNIMVLLDSNHTHDHVLAELNAYADLVTKDNYLVVFDTCVEFMPDEMFGDRPWGKGNNPYTAVVEFMKENNRFEHRKEIEEKLLITVAPGGYWQRVG